MTINKYNDETAVKLRRQLQDYYDQVKELEYRIFCISKEAQKTADEYNKYLGLEVKKNERT